MHKYHRSLCYLRFAFKWYRSTITIHHFPWQEVPSLQPCQAGHWHSLTRRTRRYSCQLLPPTTRWSNPLYWFHHDSLPAILGSSCKYRTGARWPVPGIPTGGGKRRGEGTVEEERERETDGIMGRQRVLQAERKGSPRDLAVVHQN